MDQLGDVLRGRVHVDQVDRFARLDEEFCGRVASGQNHTVVEVLVDPVAQLPLNQPEVYDHPIVVQRLGLESDHHPAVVTVQEPTFSLVI